MIWRIVGIGSPFGDDAAGWRVVERLGARLGAQEGVELLTLDRPGSGLLPHLAGAEGVILIDAVRSQGPPGTLYRLTAEEAERLPTLLSSHGFGLAQALGLARVLGVLPHALEVYGIELGRLEGEGLSTAVEQAVAELAGQLCTRFTPAPTGRSPTPRAQPGG